MDSRQQFEEWYLKKYYEGNRAAGICWLVREDCGRYTYAMPAEHYRTWQASREAITIELPVIVDKDWSCSEDECDSMRHGIIMTKHKINAAGIRTKCP